jgi:ribosome-associated protein
VTAIVRRKTAGKRKRPAAPSGLLRVIEKSLDDDKAENLVTIDLKGKSSIADFMVIASGRSARQLGAMAEHLREKLGKAGIAPVGVEGERQGDWILIDGGDVVVHLFRPEIRGLYNLEKMWGLEMGEAGRIAVSG